MLAANVATRRMPVLMKRKNDDRVAKRYCVRATVRVVRSDSKVPFGIFTGYDINMDIARHVENACTIFRDTLLSNIDESFECEDPEVVVLRECPVEITNEISFARIVDVTAAMDGEDDGYDDGYDADVDI